MKNGDLLMAITGEGKTRGMVAICSIQATINQHLASIILKRPELNNRFLLEFLRAIYAYIRNDSAGNGSTKGAITCSSIKELVIPIPSLFMQQDIVTEIEAQSAKIDKAIALAERQVEKLREYKAVLIDGAVRGKVRVGN